MPEPALHPVPADRTSDRASDDEAHTRGFHAAGTGEEIQDHMTPAEPPAAADREGEILTPTQPLLGRKHQVLTRRAAATASPVDD